LAIINQEKSSLPVVEISIIVLEALIIHSTKILIDVEEKNHYQDH